MTQLTNVNNVDPHTGVWRTLLKAWSSLHLGPVADVWLRVQSYHLSAFLMLTLCVFLVVCRLFKSHSYTQCHNHAHCSELKLWAIASHSSALLEDMHMCQSRLMDWRPHPKHLTAPRPWSYNSHVKCSLFNCAAWAPIFWCAQLPSSLLFEYLLQECSRKPVL